MFTDEDVKNLRNFAELITEKAKFDLDWSEAIQLAKYYPFIQGMVKKINDHVIELRSIKVEEAVAPKKKPATKKAK